MNKTHGMSGTPLHNIWKSLRSRCRNSRDKDYESYGGRGILVCERWNSFEAFIADLGPRPSAAYSVGRIDNNGAYSPDNCEWQTDVEQTRNMRSNVLVEINGERRTVTDWCVISGVKRKTAFGRIAAGCDPVQAVTVMARMSRRVA